MTLFKPLAGEKEMSKMRVLLVEDSKVQLEVTKLTLESRGVDVECAMTLEAALKRLARPGIDVVLLDLTLPDSMGIETLHRVRAATVEVPTVCLTGADDQEGALLAVMSGAQDYLVKGVVSDESIFRCLRYAIERHKVEQALIRSEKRLRIILENTYDAFISMDLNWRIRDWNLQAERTFGWARGEILGRPLSVIVPAHLRKQYARDVARYFSQSQDNLLRMTSELVAVHRDGHEFPIDIGIFRIKSDDDYMFCAFGRDITERKQLNERLERRVQERTDELTRSNEELRQFAKIASHDLQEPLRAVQGFVNLLAENTKGKLDQDCEEFIEYILDGTARMQQLIQSVLLHSSITAEETAYASSDCNAVLEEVLANLDASIRENKAELEIDSLPTVGVERSQLVQLFQNLISNAIKYRGTQSPRIFVGAERTVNDWLFSVRDNGIGIDSKYADKIFDMFARLHGKTKYQGTGMGLAICKKIVELHGGKIWVESEVGEGCIFLFTLPAARKLKRRASMDNNIEILLVEDTPSDIRLTQEALKRSGLQYNLTIANDGVEAMEMLNDLKTSKDKRLPDIILLDLNMPRKNGHEVLADIKADDKLRQISVVLLTVSQRDEDVMEALKLKMNYYLAKPVTAAKVSVLIKAITELQSEEKQVAGGKRGDDETHVRMVLAGNPHTSPTILGKLAQDENVRIRCRVAENPETAPDVLLSLARDENADVRVSVSENPKVSLAVVELLAKDNSEDVRMGLAGNHNMPVHVLEQLVNDENTFVSAEATKTLQAVATGAR
ncbi:MAG: response regulator [Cyanobacteria bacterium SZAS TMP-1]|nr:response regulator [Cyanobacteria bacterium SZAS TMP-1]